LLKRKKDFIVRGKKKNEKNAHKSVNTLQLGDLLCSIPAFRALHFTQPQAKTVLLGLTWARSCVLRFGRYLDGFIEFPGFAGLRERAYQVHQLPAFLIEAGNQPY
jgi:ADP-heptose:LPS heptosyltransferase